MLGPFAIISRPLEPPIFPTRYQQPFQDKSLSTAIDFILAMNWSGEQNGFRNSATGYNHPSAYEFRPVPTDWLSSPDWPVDKLDDAYATSPDSTPVFNTSTTGESWNYIDTNFKQAILPSYLNSPATETYENPISTYLQTTPQSNRNPNGGQGNAPAANVPCFPVSPIHDLAVQIKDEEDDLADEGPLCPDNALSTLTDESSPQSQGKAAWAAWGSSKESQRRSGSYKSAKRSSHIKEKERQNPRRKSSSSSAKGQWQLNGRQDVARTDSAECSRTSHNMIEKKYRTKLNDQFSSLLDTLPQDVTGGVINEDGDGDSGGTERKVSKAEVLVRAKTHIETLERANMSLESGNKALEEESQRLKAAWVRLGGQVTR